MLGPFPGKRSLSPEFTEQLSFSSGEKRSWYLRRFQADNAALTKQPTCTDLSWNRACHLLNVCVLQFRACEEATLPLNGR